MRSRAILLSLLAGAALAGSAFAADLPSRHAPPPAIMYSPEPAYSWTGFYAGVNIGGYINASRFALAASSAPLSGGGIVAGGTLGYNWEASNRFVLGLETDIDYRSRTKVNPVLSQNVSSNDGYLGTLRLRVGYELDRALVYVTGGAAYGNAVAPTSLSSPVIGVPAQRSASNPTFNVGWAIGAGVEYAVTDNWSLKAEYLYARGSSRQLVYVPQFAPVGATLISASGRSGEHMLRVGANYRFNMGSAQMIASEPVSAKY